MSLCSRRHVFFLFSLAVGLGAGAAHSQTSAQPATESLRWVAGEVPPFSWTSSGEPQGYGYELAVAMAQRLGRQSDVSFYPWARAMRMVREGQSVGIFPLARTPEREAQFHWLLPLTHIKYALLFQRNDPLSQSPLSKLRVIRVGVLRGSAGTAHLSAQHFSSVVEGNDYRDLLRMLDKGMIHAIYGGMPMIRSAIVQNGFNAEDYRFGLRLADADLYMGLSKGVPAAEVERWRSAYRELQQDGTVARLQKKYLIALDR